VQFPPELTLAARRKGDIVAHIAGDARRADAAGGYERKNDDEMTAGGVRGADDAARAPPSTGIASAGPGSRLNSGSWRRAARWRASPGGRATAAGRGGGTAARVCARVAAGVPSARVARRGAVSPPCRQLCRSPVVSGVVEVARWCRWWSSRSALLGSVAPVPTVSEACRASGPTATRRRRQRRRPPSNSPTARADQQQGMRATRQGRGRALVGGRSRHAATAVQAVVEVAARTGRTSCTGAGSRRQGRSEGVGASGTSVATTSAAHPSRDRRRCGRPRLDDGRARREVRMR
jgi:hypothetical protein